QEDGKVDYVGGVDSFVQLSATGGTPGYTYKWVNKNLPGTTISSMSSVTGLGAGTYKVLVTDANGCKDSCEVTLTQPEVLTCNATSTNATCGISDGKITVIASGGSGNYEYSKDGTTWQKSNELTGYNPGLFT